MNKPGNEKKVAGMYDLKLIIAEVETTPEIICKSQVVSQLARLYFLTSICPSKPHGKRKGQRI